MWRRMVQRAKAWAFGTGERPRTVLAGPARGLRFLIDPANKSQRLLGLDEREIAGHFRRLVARVSAFIDVGASDGYYTITAASLNPSAVCVGCEPDPANRARFERNLALNPIPEPDRVRWVPEPIGGTGRALDDVCADLPGPKLFKIDVDGAEMDVLRSGPQSMAGDESAVILEVHAPELERDSIDWLEDKGYRCRIVDKGWYRRFVPELRPIAHNRWVVATKT